MAQDKIPYLPERIEGLAEIALNLSWRWSRRARSLFKSVDPILWSLTWHNPVDMLRRADPARLAACARDPEFLELYDLVLDRMRAQESTEGTWFQTNYPDLVDRTVAYFCAEFGLHNSVPIYSGGLGVLAGDHCKAASDLGVPLVGVGLMYHKGYFDQKINLDGWQEDSDESFQPDITPLVRVSQRGGSHSLATVVASGRTVHVGAWRIVAGRVPLYLLDTNLEENDPADRELTHKLYAGGQELRLKQEWVLGVGGVRVLRALGIEPAAWHANEGHAAFMLVERVRELTQAGVDLGEAIQQVRANSVFTTHTPVPAGHDTFSPELIDSCTGSYWEELGVDRDAFLGLGHHPTIDHNSFHMTAAAIRLSSRVNGVSRRHGQVTRRIWSALWPGREERFVPIGSVTNGVHLESWMAHRIMEILDHHLGKGWLARREDPEFWKRVLDIDDAWLWGIHTRMKQRLLDFIREQTRQRWRDERTDSAHLVGAGTLLTPEPFTIGFARRFASYKRADLIFRYENRLRRLITDPWRPVQIIFAGKAHPADDEGKQVLQRVYSFTRDPSFEGRVAFVEDYELHLAHRLVQGVDLWLNLPRVPQEASGTSGMKAALNGVPQLSTLDGWWAEGYNGENGWAIPLAEKGEDVDEADFEQLFALLERDVVPLYYDRDERGIPVDWVQKMKQAIWVGGSRFTTSRMVTEYARDYYAPAMKGIQEADDPPTV